MRRAVSSTVACEPETADDAADQFGPDRAVHGRVLGMMSGADFSVHDHPGAAIDSAFLAAVALRSK